MDRVFAPTRYREVVLSSCHCGSLFSGPGQYVVPLWVEHLNVDDKVKRIGHSLSVWRVDDKLKHPEDMRQDLQD
jgi:hypothetical protein